MPNRLPPCPVCGPKHRHSPAYCPAANRATGGLQTIRNAISSAALTLEVARKELREVVALLNTEGNP